MNQTVVVHSSRAEHHAFLNLAGAHCRLRSDSPALLHSLASFITSSVPASGLLLDVHVIDQPDVRDPVHFRGMAQFVVAEYGANVLLFDIAQHTVHVWITNSAARDRKLWAEQWIPVIVGVVGLVAGVLPLHSACVVKNGRGVLIAGESMAGKSTFAVAMAKQGFQLLSDDWTYIHRERLALHACGVNVPVKLLPDAAAFFPELHKLHAAPTLNGEVAFTATSQQLGVADASCCEIAAMLFLERTATASPSFARADPGFARSYVQNSVERLPAEVRELVDIREQLIQGICGVPCWHFNYCASPLEGAAFAASFLESLEGVI